MKPLITTLSAIILGTVTSNISNILDTNIEKTTIYSTNQQQKTGRLKNAYKVYFHERTISLTVITIISYFI